MSLNETENIYLGPIFILSKNVTFVVKIPVMEWDNYYNLQFTQVLFLSIILSHLSILIFFDLILILYHVYLINLVTSYFQDSNYLVSIHYEVRRVTKQMRGEDVASEPK